MSDLSERSHVLSKNTDISWQNLHRDAGAAVLHVGSCVSQASHDTAPLCLPAKPGHGPSEAGVAFIRALSFDIVLTTLWSLLEARKHYLCGLSGSGRREAFFGWLVWFVCVCFLVCFLMLSEFWRLCKQTFDNMQFFGAFCFKLLFTTVGLCSEKNYLQICPSSLCFLVSY